MTEKEDLIKRAMELNDYKEVSWIQAKEIDSLKSQIDSLTTREE